MKIILTGANGFVGRQLALRLLQQNDIDLQLIVRKKTDYEYDHRVKMTTIDDISADTDWGEILSGGQVIIHAAARVHVMHDVASNPLDLYRATNVEGTLNLARQAVAAGIKRFIFISSIKVNGESTARGKPFNADDPANPTCSYAISKHEAEQGLLELAANNSMDVVIIRPVLIYGPGVKGNFQYMVDWLKKGIPLPLGLINNKRSFVSIHNLNDLIASCIDHPNAGNQIFLVSDGHDLSTTELLRKLSRFLGKRILLVPIPIWIVRRIAAFLGRSIEVQRLCDHLQVDISKTKDLLGWQPRMHVDNSLQAMITAQVYEN